MITKGKFSDGYDGWKKREIVSSHHSKPHYEIIFSDDTECIAEYVHNEEDAELIACAPKLFELVEELMNIIPTDILDENKERLVKKFDNVVKYLENQ